MFRSFSAISEAEKSEPSIILGHKIIDTFFDLGSHGADISSILTGFSHLFLRTEITWNVCTIVLLSFIYPVSCQVPHTHAEVSHLSTASCTYCQQRVLCRRDGICSSHGNNSSSSSSSSSSSTTHHHCCCWCYCCLLLHVDAASAPVGALQQKKQQLQQHRSQQHASLQ